MEQGEFMRNTFEKKLMDDKKEKKKRRKESGCRLILVCGWKLLSFEEQQQYWHGRDGTGEEEKEGGGLGWDLKRNGGRGRGWKSSN